MDKLIELLNEWEEKVNGRKGGWCKEHLEYQYHGPRIINKKFGFIKWLVDNDKIDFSRDGKYCEKSIEEFDGLLRADEDSLIMILAIQEKPIEFLISILK